MEKAPLPVNEKERLNVLQLYQILDTAPETIFDEVTSAAARSFQVPIALISLVDANRQWFKSCVGLEVRETGRDESFCSHTILDTKPLIIEDATLDSRFWDNPLVTGFPHIRFYAGAPLIAADGCALGTLCLIDDKPRTLTKAEVIRLEWLACSVVVRLELRLVELYLARMNNSISA